jgi:hypothetical protein
VRLADAQPKPPPPPEDLTPSQAQIWRDVTANRAPDWFDGACEALLVAYCRHVDTGNVLARAINATGPEDRRYRPLLEMAARQSATMSSDRFLARARERFEAMAARLGRDQKAALDQLVVDGRLPAWFRQQKLGRRLSAEDEAEREALTSGLQALVDRK